jgi:hypothetical protein
VHFQPGSSTSKKWPPISRNQYEQGSANFILTFADWLAARPEEWTETANIALELADLQTSDLRSSSHFTGKALKGGKAEIGRSGSNGVKRHVEGHLMEPEMTGLGRGRTSLVRRTGHADKQLSVMRSRFGGTTPKGAVS